MHVRLWLAAAALALSARGVAAAEPPPEADLIARHARIWTLNAPQPEAEAVAAPPRPLPPVGSDPPPASWRRGGGSARQPGRGVALRRPCGARQPAGGGPRRKPPGDPGPAGRRDRARRRGAADRRAQGCRGRALGARDPGAEPRAAPP